MNKNRTEWVIHVWGKKRDTLELTDVEKFHIDMMKMFQEQQKKFDKITVNIALDDINDMSLYNFLKDEIDNVVSGFVKNVEYKVCQNNPKLGEYVTFKPYVFDRIGEDVDIFYSHFKGYSTYFKSLRKSFPERVAWFSEMFWSYIMYRYSFDMADVEEKLKDKCTYFWTVLKCKDTDVFVGYYKKYRDGLLSAVPELAEYIKGDMLMNSPGGFGWYNLKNIKKVLDDKPSVLNVSDKMLIDNLEKYNILCTHFSECYLTLFLDESDCYSVKDYNDEINKLSNTMYVMIYPSKKFGVEFIKDFEKYLIGRGMM